MTCFLLRCVVDEGVSLMTWPRSLFHPLFQLNFFNCGQPSFGLKQFGIVHLYFRELAINNFKNQLGQF